MDGSRARNLLAQIAPLRLRELSMRARPNDPNEKVSLRASLSKVQSVDQRMRVGMRCRLSPTDVPSHTSGAATRHERKLRPHSITSSATARRVGGNSRLSARAVFKFTSISNPTGCSTGSSAGWRFSAAAAVAR
jgi:hypothetical protein